MKKVISGINNYKLVAALLVIAIHTSPLTSLSPEADFVLTRILARTAVPFFFMVTGYFVLPRAVLHPDQAFAYLKRILLIYLMASLLYLPVNLYAGHFENLTLAKLLKMMFLDGTFYHLWYLPALMLAFVLVLVWMRMLPMYLTGILTFALYLMGLFGDSYYGFLPETSWLHGFYTLIFEFFEYTRNGLFYAPVFLFLGCLLATEKRPARSLSLMGTAAFSILLIAEGYTLHLLEVQRHDSMYLFLLPLMYVLFSALMDLKLPNVMRYLPSDFPLLIYLLHPMFIILVRGFAKVTGLTLFVTNSLLHFFAVTVSVCCFAWILSTLRNRLRLKHRRPHHRKGSPTHEY